MTTAYTINNTTVIRTRTQEEVVADLVQRATDTVYDILMGDEYDAYPTREPMTTPHKPTAFRTH